MTLRQLMLWLLLVPAFLYLVVLTTLYLGQTGMIFPVRQVARAGPPPASTEHLSLVVASGDRLQGLHIPPSESGGERTLILGFGGNATNAEHIAALLHTLYPRADVVAFHYRGYPPSSGSSSAAALREDALRIFDAMRARFRPGRTIAVGCSVGSGVASALAAARPLDGLILITPFDSLAAVVSDHYPWVPVRLLLRHRLDPARALHDRRVPVAILAAGADELVRPARTEALRRALPNLRFDRTIAGASHDDIYDHPDFAPAMDEALARILAPES